MANVKFFRGLRANYEKNVGVDISNGIYFATDTQEIIVNEKSYGGGIKDVEVKPHVVTEDQDPVECLVISTTSGSEYAIPLEDLLPEAVAEMVMGLSSSLVADGTEKKNFLVHESEENKLAVRKMDADVTETTNRIYVAGGPLANSSLVSILPKDENNTAYIDAGTNIQDILLKLFTEITFPDVTIKSNGSISTSISAPSYSFTYNDGNNDAAEANGKTVEVGTKVSVGAATLNAVTYNVTKRSSGTFTYGYSDSIDSEIKGKGSNFEVNAVEDSISLVANETYTMSRDFTGFNNMTDDSATESTTSTAVTLDGKDCTVSFGTNKVKVSITGPRYECNFPELPSKYIVSNIGTKDEDEMSPSSPATTTKVKQQNKPGNSKEYSITGAYYQFSRSFAKGVTEPSAPTDSSTEDFTKSFNAPTKYTLGNGTQLSKVIIYTTSTPTKVVYVNPANAAGGGADLMATPTMYQFTENAISLTLPDGSKKNYNKIDIHALGGENFATGDPNTNYIEIKY